MTNSLGSSANTANIFQRAQDLINQVREGLLESHPLTRAQELDTLEESLHHQARQLADLLTAYHLQKALDSEAMAKDAKELVTHQKGKQKHYGHRVVNVRFQGGSTIAICTSYFARNCDEKKKRGEGFYPALILLGIHDRCSPGLASKMSLFSAALCSFEEARHMLSTQCSQLNIKTIRNVVKRFSARTRLAQRHDEQEMFSESTRAQGHRIVVSTDGGRLRVRAKKRGHKTKKGYTRFKGEWKEPKLFIIYIANEDGRQDKTFSPIIDGSLGGPDETFSLLAYYLKKLNIVAADKVLFVADGALWIWERVKKVLLSTGIKAEQIYELIDFYHAIEHLSCFANLKTKWSTPERHRWLKKMRRKLLKGKIDEVIHALKVESKGTKNANLRKERNYFIKNRDRMLYKQVADIQFPIGSGAIESAIRRVVNLRLKGPCIFWNKDTANEMLMLRCFDKSGRWNMLENWAFSCAQ